MWVNYLNLSTLISTGRISWFAESLFATKFLADFRSEAKLSIWVAWDRGLRLISKELIGIHRNRVEFWKSTSKFTHQSCPVSHTKEPESSTNFFTFLVEIPFDGSNIPPSIGPSLQCGLINPYGIPCPTRNQPVPHKVVQSLPWPAHHAWDVVSSIDWNHGIHQNLQQETTWSTWNFQIFWYYTRFLPIFTWVKFSNST